MNHPTHDDAMVIAVAALLVATFVIMAVVTITAVLQCAS